MTWNEAMKAVALAAETERKAKEAGGVADTPWRWNANDVWLSRVRQSRDSNAKATQSDPARQPRQDTVPRR